MLSKAGSFNSGTGTVSSTQEITIGFQAKIIFFWWNGRTESTDTVGGATHRRGFGVATSISNRYCYDTRSVDAGGSSVSSAYLHNAACIMAHTDTTVDGLIDVSAIGATSFTLIVDDQMPHDLRVHYLALGGSDVINVDVGIVTADGTGKFIVSGLSFQPNFAMLIGGAALGAPPAGSATTSIFSIGAAIGASNEFGVSAGTDDASANMDAAAFATDGDMFNVIAASVGNTISLQTDLSSFNSDGFQTTATFPASTYPTIYVALNCTNVIVGNSLTQTDTTTDIVVSGLGWKPAAGFVVSHCRAENGSTTLTRTDKTSIGAFTSATERVAHGVRDEDAVADSNVATAVEHDEVYVHIDDTADSIVGLMDVKSVDSGGVTFIMDDADPAQAWFGYILFGPAGAGGETKSLTDTGIGTDGITGLSASLSLAESSINVEALSLSAELSLSDVGLSIDQQLVLENINVSDVGGECINIESPGLTGVIVDINLNDGTLNGFTSTVTDGGDLSVTGSAALAGTNYGLSCLIDDTNAIYGQKTVDTDNSGIIRLRFYIDPNGISIPDVNAIRCAYLYTSGNVLIGFVALYYFTASGYQLAAAIYNDAGSLDFCGSVPSAANVISDAEHYVEFQVTKSDGSNNGTSSLWIDGNSIAAETGKDNDTRFADFSYIRFGAPVVPASASGTFYLDELVVNNDGSEIGPVQLSVPCEGEQLTISGSIPVYDAGTGLEFITLSALIPLSDSGLGIDEITVTELGQIIKTILDAASGSDVISIQAILSTTEIAIGQDAISLQVTLGLSDSALGEDFLDLLAGLNINENGIGIDDLTQLLASLSMSESSSANDLLDILASLSISDIGNGLDSINILTTALKTILDTGLGSDQISVSVGLSLQDTGSGTDTLSIQVSLQITDTGLGADTISVIAFTLKEITDLAFGIDGVDIAASLNIGETSYGIDDPAILALLELLENGAGLDTPDISASLTITDTSSATDIISILQAFLVLISDVGSGNDVITNITASIPVSESGLGSDQIGQILASLLVTDLGTGVDVVIKYDTSANILKIEFILNKPRVTFAMSKPNIWTDLIVPNIVSSDAEPTIDIELLQPMVKFSLKAQ